MSLRLDTIRLAHSGSPSLRVALLPVLAREFPSQEALKKYLGEHPDADESKHSVAKPDAESKGEDAEEPDEDFGNLGVKADRALANLGKSITSFFEEKKGWATDTAKKAKAKVEAAPKHVQAFITDPEFRRETMKAGVVAAKKAPGQIAKHVWDTFKEEAREKKSGFQQAGRMLSGKAKWKDLSDQEKDDFKATAQDLVVTTVLFVAGGGLAGASKAPLKVAVKGLQAVGKDFMFGMGSGAATKVVSETADNVMKLKDTVEAGGFVAKSIGSLIKRLVVGAEKGEEFSEEEIGQLLTVAAIAATMKHLEENDISEDTMLKAFGAGEKAAKKEGGVRTASDIGPYIRFDNRLWVDSSGYKMNPKPGGWDRLRLVNPKSGLPLKTEVGVYWGKPGELSVYESHRRQTPHKYEDVGVFLPTVTIKDVEKPPAEARTLAKQVALKLRAEGFGADEARAVTSDVAEDVNFHSLARLLNTRSHESSVDTGDISVALDFGVFAAGWFGVYLAQAFGDSATAKLIIEQMITDTARWKQQELAEHFRFASLRGRAVRLAYSNVALRPHLLPLLRVAFGGTHVAVKDLPTTVQRALKEVGYGRRDIEVEATTTFRFQDFGGDGMRGFTSVVNMETGASKVTYGSWGGPNPYERGRLVDDDDRPHNIPMNGAIIQGHEGGYRPVYATMKVHPDNMAALIPTKVELTPQEEMAISILDGYKPAYRAEYFEEHGLGLYKADNPLIEGLVRKGLVKVTGSGIQITTSGKNARNPRVRP